MIIFTDKTGQLGNQLFEFSTFITNSLENNTILVNLFFRNMESTLKDTLKRYYIIKLELL